MKDKGTIFDKGHHTPIDNLSGAEASISLAEAEINVGIAFSVSQLYGPIAAGETFYTLAKIPVDVFMHFHRMEVSSLGFTDVELFESPTHLDDGDLAAAVNHNRIFAALHGSEGSQIIIKGNVTVSDPGKFLTGVTFGNPGANSSGKGQFAGSAAAASKFIMNPGTEYTIGITNKEESLPISGRFTAFWFENGHGLSVHAEP